MKQAVSSDWLVLAVLLGLTMGCGGGAKVLTVTGHVTYNGAPVEKGEVSFVPVEGGAPDGGTIENGAFKLRTKPGMKQVEIRGSRPVVPQPKLESGVAYEDFIPAQFNRETTLTAEVSSSSRTFEFNLTAATP